VETLRHGKTGRPALAHEPAAAAGMAPVGRVVPHGLPAITAAPPVGPSPTPAAAATPNQPPRGPRQTGTAEERELVTAYLSDFARELGDEAPLSSTVTRAIKLFTTAGVPRDRWPDLLYQMRAITKEHSGQITKKPADPKQRAPAKVRMPYALAVLEDLVGLKEHPAHPPDRTAHGS
jgi:hypothetical protein